MCNSSKNNGYRQAMLRAIAGRLRSAGHHEADIQSILDNALLRQLAKAELEDMRTDAGESLSVAIWKTSDELLKELSDETSR